MVQIGNFHEGTPEWEHFDGREFASCHTIIGIFYDELQNAVYLISEHSNNKWHYRMLEHFHNLYNSQVIHKCRGIQAK